jgi:hypothetical protein
MVYFVKVRGNPACGVGSGLMEFKEILENALDVFVTDGYADTTPQKIADRCGITRTILYLNFKNKRKIFMFKKQTYAPGEHDHR